MTPIGLVIRHLIATNTRLAIVPRERGQERQGVGHLRARHEEPARGEPATFTASLINPIPYGKIETSGTFGPWQSNEPGTSAPQR